MKIMGFSGLLAITLFVIWCGSEVIISLISLGNRSKEFPKKVDGFSYFVVWFSTIPPIVFEYLIQSHPTFVNGFGNVPVPPPLMGSLGCLVMAFGISIRLAAVFTLKKEFTLRVSIIEKHEIVDTGIYRVIRHPAYLGHLASLLGTGLILGNWIGLMGLVALPLAGILYRIHIEERALLHHFGSAYQEYASRTKRLLPGIW